MNFGLALTRGCRRGLGACQPRKSLSKIQSPTTPPQTGGYILSSCYLFYILYIQMPTVKTIHQYRLRVDGEDDPKMTQFLKKHTSRYLLVHHVLPTGNPHYHAYVETHLTQGNFSNYVKKEMGVSKGDYSNQTCADDRKHEYLSYLYNTKHGNKSRTVSYENFGTLDIKTYQEQALQISKEFKTKMALGKKTQYDIVQITLERCLKLDKTLLAHIIYDELVEVLKETRTVARPNHVRDMIFSVMVFSGQRQAEESAKELALKFFS